MVQSIRRKMADGEMHVGGRGKGEAMKKQTEWVCANCGVVFKKKIAPGCVLDVLCDECDKQIQQPSDYLNFGQRYENVLTAVNVYGAAAVLAELALRRQVARKELELINGRINAVKNKVRYVNKVGPKNV